MHRAGVVNKAMPTSLTSDTEALLRAALPDVAFTSDVARYLEEPRGKFFGPDGFVVRPGDVGEVSQILKIANQTGTAVVPYGGGTGLVSGQVAPELSRPIVVSLERMNTVREVSPQENVLVADAGAILQDIQEAATAADRLFPLSLASQGTARIGGNLSTNAGGINVLRYGTTRDLCLGLEAVLPDGSIWNGLTRLRKDNTGYDLRNLMIGAEGTLGIITAAALKLFPLPKNHASAMLVLSDVEGVLDLLTMAQEMTDGAVSAFELIHRQGFDFLDETGLDYRDPFPSERPEWVVLIRVATSDARVPSETLEALFIAAAEAELVVDGVIAQSEAQADALWHIRETIPEGNKRIGAIASHDISLPLSQITQFIASAPQHLASLKPHRLNCFGHIGDGNLHFNIFPPKGGTKADGPDKDETSRLIHDLVHELGGSFSAEHGLGRFKAGELERYGDPTKLTAMRAIKAALDPNGIMNPGAVLRATRNSSG